MSAEILEIFAEGFRQEQRLQAAVNIRRGRTRVVGGQFQNRHVAKLAAPVFEQPFEFLFVYPAALVEGVIDILDR